MRKIETVLKCPACFSKTRINFKNLRGKYNYVCPSCSIRIMPIFYNKTFMKFNADYVAMLQNAELPEIRQACIDAVRAPIYSRFIKGLFLQNKLAEEMMEGWKDATDE